MLLLKVIDVSLAYSLQLKHYLSNFFRYLPNACEFYLNQNCKYLSFIINFTADWTETGERNKSILFDMDYTLQVKTSAALGTNGEAGWQFVNGDDRKIFRLAFKTRSIKITNCMTDFLEIDVPEATGDIRVWTIELYDSKLLIICNGKRVFEFQFSDSTQKACSDWRKKPTHIRFTHDHAVHDTKSDLFRNRPRGMDLFSLSETLLHNHFDF